MAHDDLKNTDRRTFLQTGAIAAAAAASLAPGLKGQEAPADANVKSPAIPRRPLGKTGVEITMLDQRRPRCRATSVFFGSRSPKRRPRLRLPPRLTRAMATSRSVVRPGRR